MGSVRSSIYQYEETGAMYLLTGARLSVSGTIISRGWRYFTLLLTYDRRFPYPKYRVLIHRWVDTRQADRWTDALVHRR